MNGIRARAQKFNVNPLAYATLLVAFFLRLYRLEDKNVWWDEGWSLWLAQKDAAWIALRTAADEHPPLHYWMLKVWGESAGWSAFAGRYLSVVFGILTIALLCRIGSRVGGRWIGLLAALLLAVSRFHIWWSQDIKNYTPSIFLAFAAVWFALDLIDRPTWKAVVGYVICAEAALWTHYLSALILLACNVYAGLLAVGRYVQSKRVSSASQKSGQRSLAGSSLQDTQSSSAQTSARRRVGSMDHWATLAPHCVRCSAGVGSLTRWLLAQLIVAGLFLPWMWLYLQNAITYIAAPVFDFGVFLGLVATVLPLGVTTQIDQYVVPTLLLTLVAALGCLPWRAWRRERLLFAIVVLLPPLFIYALSLTPASFFAPKIQARYLLILAPAYVLLLAFGLARLATVRVYLGLAGLIVVLVANAWVLVGYYGERRLDDEYSTLANTINSFAEPGDLVLLDTDQEWPTLLYYLRMPLDWLGAPNGARMDSAKAEELVGRAIARHDAVWVVAIPDALATDPQQLLTAELARALPEQYEQSFGDKRLLLYASAPRDLVHVPPQNFAAQYERRQSLSSGLELLGFDLPVREAQAGDVLRVVTYWQARMQTTAQLTLRIGGNTQGAPLNVPVGDRVRVETDLVVPPGTQGQAALDLIGVESVELAQVSVEPRGSIAAVGAITHPVDYALGQDIQLVGYDLPTARFHPGESVPITLYWRAARPVDKDYVVFVHLLGTVFNPEKNNLLWGQVDRAPREGTYPTTAWVPGETVPDEYLIPSDSHAPPGRYQIEVGLYDPASGVRLPILGGEQRDSILLTSVEIAGQ